MARRKYLSLEEARKQKRLDRFCKEHPSKADKRFLGMALLSTKRASATIQPYCINTDGP